MLSVNRTSLFDDEVLERTDNAYKQLCINVIRRDAFTCQHCGFCSAKYMKILSKNSKYDTYAEENYVTACLICFFEHRLQLAGKIGAGKIIYLPEITQAQLNTLIHANWSWQEQNDSDDPMFSADVVVNPIESRINATVSILGKQAFNPLVMGRVLKDMTDEYYDKRHEALAGFRFFPNKETFEKQIEYWSEHVYPLLQVDESCA